MPRPSRAGSVSCISTPISSRTIGPGGVFLAARTDRLALAGIGEGTLDFGFGPIAPVALDDVFVAVMRP